MINSSFEKIRIFIYSGVTKDLLLNIVFIQIIFTVRKCIRLINISNKKLETEGIKYERV